MAGVDDTPLSRWRRAAYGFGDFGFNLYWTTISFFILYFYTDVVGLSGTVAGLVFLIAMLWDGIIDPAMGYYAQRTIAVLLMRGSSTICGYRKIAIVPYLVPSPKAFP